LGKGAKRPYSDKLTKLNVPGVYMFVIKQNSEALRCLYIGKAESSIYSRIQEHCGYTLNGTNFIYSPECLKSLKKGECIVENCAKFDPSLDIFKEKEDEYREMGSHYLFAVRLVYFEASKTEISEIPNIEGWLIRKAQEYYRSHGIENDTSKHKSPPDDFCRSINAANVAGLEKFWL
jgi:hypothetical protein